MTGTGGERCCVLNADVPMAGSALADTRILVVEQPGAWGRDAVADSALDPGLLAEAGRGARVLLARHCDRPGPQSLRHWWSLRATDEGVVAAAGRSPWREPLTDAVWPAAHPRPQPGDSGPTALGPAVFMCTNGKRDACCAQFGRGLLRRFPRQPDLWEVSHLGGHRFAPTALLFPSGLMAGRLDYESSAAVLSGAPPPMALLRGRVGRSAQRQVAELAVAARAGVAPDRLRSQQHGEALVEVASPAGDRQPWDWYQVRLEQRTGPALPKSCGAAPQVAQWWQEAQQQRGEHSAPHGDFWHEEQTTR